MRIGIDLRSMEGGAQHRGIGRYASSLIEALSHIDHRNEYVFFVSSAKVHPPSFAVHDAFRVDHASGRGQGLRNVKYVRILYLTPRPLNIDTYNLDVFFQLDIMQPVKAKTTPIVSVLYDLIPFLDGYKEIYQHVHLGGYTPGHVIGWSRSRLRWKILERWQRKFADAAKVISISEHSRLDLLRMIPAVKPQNIVAIPLAAGELPHSDATAETHMHELGLQQFIFYVGGADPRKGLVNLAQEFETVWQHHPKAQLVLAGKEITDKNVPEARRLQETIQKLSRPKQVLLLGFITDAELAWLYQHAAAFVFPSRYEGFGLPVLEAMQAGCPVVAYKNSSIPEVAGDAALLLEDGTSMAPAIIDLLSSSALRKQLATKGARQAAHFTWERTARATLAVLESTGNKENL